MSNLNSQNQDNYENLLVSIEAGKDILNWLIAVCDDSDNLDGRQLIIMKNIK